MNNNYLFSQFSTANHVPQFTGTNVDNVDGHLIINSLDYSLHQFSTEYYVPQDTTNVDDHLIIDSLTYPPHQFSSTREYVQQEAYAMQENLELEEQMGRVGSRLSDETIKRHLRIRSYDVTSKRMEEEADKCAICQGEYEKGEFIGGLQCRHEYHVECVKKWLKQHNSCPICRADAVSPNANQTAGKPYHNC
ncbi:hypothetical protein POM88_040308 [Heracleum sosnowskyi]|uniref:RING-type E3 ubiquitin transferase n=1 Tax=Heracleum sosnowskyi TaxID=360622 RepID=A0AAD8HBR7_9APIA|nr:hypothetical protein POM88_040308 [Heracleum sosnowskyi]